MSELDVVAMWVVVVLVVVLVVDVRLARYRGHRARAQARQVTTWRPPVTFIRPGRPWGWQDRTPAGHHHHH